MTISRSTSRPIRARISRGALQHNYRQVRQFAPGAKAWAVIKANAYGHGQWRAVEAREGVQKSSWAGTWAAGAG